MKFFSIFIIVGIFFQAGCVSKPDPEISFYYWKTKFQLSEAEKLCLKVNKAKQIYLRYCDIQLDPITKLPVPISPVVIRETFPHIKIIPVIYIENAVFLDKKTNVKELAIHTIGFVDQINESAKIKTDEMQIDCDWTLNSRDQFLGFINELKKQTKKKISATIRLHQIKYAEQTKIPEVNYGVLMYYNMGKINAANGNSIYDRNIALKYLEQLKTYPLPLKVAFPIFSWGVHIRNNKVIALKAKLDIEKFVNDTNFVVTGNRINAIHPGFNSGIYFKQNDYIKIESINEVQLKQMVSDLKHKLRDTPAEIIFYDLDLKNINRYEKSLYQTLANRF